MSENDKNYEMLVDYITGKTVPNVGTEEIRQRVEQYLVEEKGYNKEDICVDADIEIDIDGSRYVSQLDLVISVESSNVMVIKCAAGSLESREREVISASRIFASSPIPYAVVSDSKTAVIYASETGKKIGEGLKDVPSRTAAEKIISIYQPVQIPEKRLKKEKIIFRSYDSMNVNVSRKISI
ncbi:MAG: type I restriction enzyme HsdR N-terminal domain-containing protein [Desulfobacterales bacterium]|nr:type I restriction enzyme HsdR N-terminal domain-containing protein [Desulfobacterales bacterium]